MPKTISPNHSSSIPLDYYGRPLTWAPKRKRVRRSRSMSVLNTRVRERSSQPFAQPNAAHRVVKCLIFVIPCHKDNSNDKFISIEDEEHKSMFIDDEEQQNSKEKIEKEVVKLEQGIQNM